MNCQGSKEDLQNHGPSPKRPIIFPPLLDADFLLAEEARTRIRTSGPPVIPRLVFKLCNLCFSQTRQVLGCHH